MKLLLDTHVFLWFVLNDRQLTEVACSLISNPDNDVLISPATYWEIAIKVSLGKYQLPSSFEEWMEQQIQVNEFTILPISIAHAATIATLPFHHRDPFDRLLVAQAITEAIALISADAALDSYAITRHW
jgi:PIN domain nuclease of toxin-antitoxin system